MCPWLCHPNSFIILVWASILHVHSLFINYNEVLLSICTLATILNPDAHVYVVDHYLWSMVPANLTRIRNLYHYTLGMPGTYQVCTYCYFFFQVRYARIRPRYGLSRCWAEMHCFSALFPLSFFLPRFHSTWAIFHATPVAQHL